MGAGSVFLRRGGETIDRGDMPDIIVKKRWEERAYV